MAKNKNKAFNTKQSNFNDYMAQLDDLLRKNRGGSSLQGFDVNPNAFLVPGKVQNASGLGNDQFKDQISYQQYSPGSTPINAPNVGQVAPYQDTQGFDDVSTADTFLEAFNNSYNQVNSTPGTATTPGTSG